MAGWYEGSREAEPVCVGASPFFKKIKWGDLSMLKEPRGRGAGERAIWLLVSESPLDVALGYNY